MADALDHTAEIVSAHVRNNRIEADRLPELIQSVFYALTMAAQSEPVAEVREPAVPIRKSVFDDHIVCLECGKGFRTMKRHLQTEHNLTTDEYRQRFALPHDYPLVAPEYAQSRAAIAKKVGLGRKPGTRVRRKRA